MTTSVVKVLVTLGALGSLAGCASMGTQGANGLASGDNSGLGSITGNAKAALRESLKVCGPRDVVTLTPVTEETEQFMLAAYGDTQLASVRYDTDPNSGVAGIDDPLPAYVQTSNCPGGRFHFENIAAGEYFVISYLHSRALSNFFYTGEDPVGARFEAISMMQRVTVVAGEREVVHLRPRNEIAFSETEIALRSDN